MRETARKKHTTEKDGEWTACSLFSEHVLEYFDVFLRFYTTDGNDQSLASDPRRRDRRRRRKDTATPTARRIRIRQKHPILLDKYRTGGTTGDFWIDVSALACCRATGARCGSTLACLRGKGPSRMCIGVVLQN